MQIVQFGWLYSDNILTVGVLVLFYSLFKIFGKTFQNEKKISEHYFVPVFSFIYLIDTCEPSSLNMSVMYSIFALNHFELNFKGIIIKFGLPQICTC